MLIKMTAHRFSLEEILLDFLGAIYLADKSYAILNTKEPLSVPDIWNTSNKILEDVVHVDYSIDTQSAIQKCWEQSESYKPGVLHFPTMLPITYPRNSFIVVEILPKSN
ncbi:MAG TPA: hypothetical protein VGE63_01985 [Candidatus Paceibacterota bacterium]